MKRNHSHYEIVISCHVCVPTRLLEAPSSQAKPNHLYPLRKNERCRPTQQLPSRSSSRSVPAHAHSAVSAGEEMRVRFKFGLLSVRRVLAYFRPTTTARYRYRYGYGEQRRGLRAGAWRSCCCCRAALEFRSATRCVPSDSRR